MDADDVALTQRFERQLDFVAQHPGIVATSTRGYFINARSRRVAQVAPADLATEQRFHERIREFRPIQILHSGAVIRRDALEVIGGYRPAFGAASDMDLWMRLSEQGLLPEQQEHLMEYRIHSGADLAARFRAAHQGTAWAPASWGTRGSRNQRAYRSGAQSCRKPIAGVPASESLAQAGGHIVVPSRRVTEGEWAHVSSHPATAWSSGPASVLDVGSPLVADVHAVALGR